MPIAVAVTLLYAYYKTKRNDKAVDMGYRMSYATRLSQWVQDYGALILGYILFDEEKYAPVDASAEQQLPGAPPPLYAVDVFAKISQSEILGHNVDKYWAAAHFNQGLQLLAVDQRAKAFDAFARSLGQRASGAKNTNLAPLFLHFGLQNLESGNGNRARQSFVLMQQSFGAQADADEAQLLYTLLAEMGQLLCETLIGEEEDLGGIAFLDLLWRIEDVETVPLVWSSGETINARAL